MIPYKNIMELILSGATDNEIKNMCGCDVGITDFVDQVRTLLTIVCDVDQSNQYHTTDGSGKPVTISAGSCARDAVILTHLLAQFTSIRGRAADTVIRAIVMSDWTPEVNKTEESEL